MIGGRLQTKDGLGFVWGQQKQGQVKPKTPKDGAKEDRAETEESKVSSQEA